MPKAEIIGLGRSGIAAAKLLNKDGWNVTLVDSMTEGNLASRTNARELQASRQELAAIGIIVKLGATITLSGNVPDLIVVSPGVPWDITPLLAAREQGIETIGEIELAWRYLKTVPWVGITGTNGKTTTTALIAAIFQQAGFKAPACGNIGNAACELALQNLSNPSNKLDWIIAELSSYQIEASQAITPRIGIWTTFTPDHLERHKTLENYYQIKASLLHRCQQQILNGDDRYLQTIAVKQFQDVCWTTIASEVNLGDRPKPSVYLQDSWIVAFGELICPISLFKMPGQHNLQNLLMAVGAAKLAGIDQRAIANAIATFPGVPHRLEYICTYQGVKYINDSKATNYDAAQVGLASVDAPAILIAGGEAKAGDDHLWIETIKAKVAVVLLIGQAAPIFAKTLSNHNYHQYEIVETLERAIARSLELIDTIDVTTVLLSPACASFDQYLSFEHRGDHFRELCLSIFR
ncbi:MAG: UDP-N-acetylmuramoyl-L-alanine--D-glutamate ligase [Pleurocapsa sp.]